MGYTLATITELSKNCDEIHVIHSEKRKLTPFKLHPIKNVIFYTRSSYSTLMIMDLINSINPDLTVVSGWQDRGYLQVASVLRKKCVPVVSGFDAHWYGSIRQYIASYFSFYLKQYFSHAWVSGPYQFEYA